MLIMRLANPLFEKADFLSKSTFAKADLCLQHGKRRLLQRYRHIALCRGQILMKYTHLVG